MGHPFAAGGAQKWYKIPLLSKTAKVG